MSSSKFLQNSFRTVYFQKNIQVTGHSKINLSKGKIIRFRREKTSNLELEY